MQSKRKTRPQPRKRAKTIQKDFTTLELERDKRDFLDGLVALGSLALLFGASFFVGAFYLGWI